MKGMMDEAQEIHGMAKFLREEEEGRKAKREIAILDDEAINLRIEEYYLKGKNGKEIKEALGIDLSRLHEGMEIVRLRWRNEAEHGVLREKLMAGSRAVRRKAWLLLEPEEGGQGLTGDRGRIGALGVILNSLTFEAKVAGFLVPDREGALKEETGKKLLDFLQSAEIKSVQVIEQVVASANQDS